ncbi:hypothetical protein [Aliiglaciecola sp. M165]|nr:hypothetical protein [Aliiglaciecola sp. M165]
MRAKGKLASWDADKGFGFLGNGNLKCVGVDLVEQSILNSLQS